MTVPKPILSIRDLTLVLETAGRKETVLNNFSLDVPRGQTLALVGESGSGKTLAALSILGLLPGVVKNIGGSINFNEKNLLTISESELRKIRGNRIGMIFQEPSTSLNPLMSVGKQIGEPLKTHRGLGSRIVKEQVLALMELVGIPDPRRRYRSLPQQLSGGVRQRVVIAMALACRPELILADELTTALDATVQAQILDLLARLIQDLRMSVLLITHDIGVVASLANRVAVLHSGQVVEEGSVYQILKTPLHPYTRSLLKFSPSEGRLSQNNQVMPMSSKSSLGEADSKACSLINNCPMATDRCRESSPAMIKLEGNHNVRCVNIKR